MIKKGQAPSIKWPLKTNIISAHVICLVNRARPIFTTCDTIKTLPYLDLDSLFQIANINNVQLDHSFEWNQIEVAKSLNFIKAIRWAQEHNYDYCLIVDDRFQLFPFANRLLIPNKSDIIALYNNINGTRHIVNEQRWDFPICLSRNAMNAILNRKYQVPFNILLNELSLNGKLLSFAIQHKNGQCYDEEYLNPPSDYHVSDHYYSKLINKIKFNFIKYQYVHVINGCSIPNDNLNQMIFNFLGSCESVHNQMIHNNLFHFTYDEECDYSSLVIIRVKSGSFQWNKSSILREDDVLFVFNSSFQLNNLEPSSLLEINHYR